MTNPISDNKKREICTKGKYKFSSTKTPTTIVRHTKTTFACSRVDSEAISAPLLVSSSIYTNNTNTTHFSRLQNLTASSKTLPYRTPFPSKFHRHFTFYNPAKIGYGYTSSSRDVLPHRTQIELTLIINTVPSLISISTLFQFLSMLQMKQNNDINIITMLHVCNKYYFYITCNTCIID